MLYISFNSGWPSPAVSSLHHLIVVFRGSIIKRPAILAVLLRHLLLHHPRLRLILILQVGFLIGDVLEVYVCRIGEEYLGLLLLGLVLLDLALLLL